MKNKNLICLKKIYWKIFFVFILILKLNYKGFSLEEKPSEFLLFEQIPIVFSASKIEEKITEASSAISVITSEDLKNWGIIDLPDAFRRIPGMDVIALDGNHWEVRSRGFNDVRARRGLVLIDGMSVYTSLISDVYWSYLPLIVEDIEKIEIIRGANDTLFGFNAFDGVINITTKKPKAEEEFFGKYVYGTYGENKFVGRYMNSLDLKEYGKLDFKLSYSFDETRGYGDNFGKEFQDKKKAHVININTKYTFNDNFNIEFLFGNNFGIYNYLPADYFVHESCQLDVDFEFELLRFNYDFTDQHKAYLQLYRWEVDQDYYNGYRDYQNIPFKWEQRERQYDIEFQDSFSLFDEKFQTVIGASYRHNTIKAIVVNRSLADNQLQSVEEDLFSVFINEKIRLIEGIPYINSLILTGGITAEWSHLIRNMVWAPRVSLLYSPIKNNVIRFTYARANRLPSFYEKYGTIFAPHENGSIHQLFGDINIQQETVDSYEVGYSGHFLDGKIKVDIDTFYANYLSIINLYGLQEITILPSGEMLPRLIRMTNNSKLKSIGLESMLTLQPFKWLSFYINYTYESIIEEKNPDNFMTIDFKDTVPKHKGNIGLDLKFNKNHVNSNPYLKGLFLNINLGYRSKYRTINDKAEVFPRDNYKIKEHFRLDCSIGKSFFDDKLEISFIGQNLIGNGNREDQYVKVPRMFFFTVSLKSFPWDFLKKDE